jgi:hypothetical protein
MHPQKTLSGLQPCTPVSNLKTQLMRCLELQSNIYVKTLQTIANALRINTVVDSGPLTVEVNVVNSLGTTGGLSSLRSKYLSHGVTKLPDGQPLPFKRRLQACPWSLDEIFSFLASFLPSLAKIGVPIIGLLSMEGDWRGNDELVHPSPTVTERKNDLPTVGGQHQLRWDMQRPLLSGTLEMQVCVRLS